MARHLHEQSGGNPRDQGPVPELANEPPSPSGRDDFPDAPDHDAGRRRGGDLTDEQLDDFASRLGLTDDADRDESASDEGGDEVRADAADRTVASEGRETPVDPDVDAESEPVDRIRRIPAVMVHRVRLVRRPVGRVLMVVARAADGTGSWLRTRGERLRRDVR